MVELFGSVRDAWIQEDLNGWLAPNRIYEGVADPVRKAMHQHEVYIVTTKQVGNGRCWYRDTHLEQGRAACKERLMTVRACALMVHD